MCGVRIGERIFEGHLVKFWENITLFGFKEPPHLLVKRYPNVNKQLEGRSARHFIVKGQCDRYGREISDVGYDLIARLDGVRI